MKPFLLAVFFACIAFSCRTVEYVPIETIKSDTAYVFKLQRDSIYERDSIYVHSKNDTVFIEKFRYKYVDKLIHDTAYISKVDSIQVPYPVEAQLTRWQQFKQDVGGIALALLSIVVLYIVYKLVF